MGHLRRLRQDAMTDQPTAHEVLALALVDAIDAGLIVPCAGSGDWIADDYRKRARAAQACDGCPVLDQCAAAAESTEEKHGVWGAVDRTPRPKSARRTAA